MYKIEKMNWGFKLTFSGFIQIDEMKRWAEESKKALLLAPNEFYVFVDMRTLKPMAQDAQECMKETQNLYKKSGMKRSVVLLDNFLTKNQFNRIAKESGIYEWERYIAPSQTPDWENVCLNWILKGIDPDLS